NLEVANWAANALAKEQSRIEHALIWLESICNELESAGYPTTVMKSLDHWPDLGNDLDLYSSADEEEIVGLMIERFKARIEPRSWGGGLANKWGFAIPGVRGSVGIRVGGVGWGGGGLGVWQRVVGRGGGQGSG